MNEMNTVLHRLKGDRVIWMTVLFLGLISLLAVYSSISSLAFKRDGGSTMHFLVKHGFMLLSGGAIMYFVSRQRYTIYSRLSQLSIGLVAVGEQQRYVTDQQVQYGPSIELLKPGSKSPGQHGLPRGLGGEHWRIAACRRGSARGDLLVVFGLHVDAPNIV